MRVVIWFLHISRKTYPAYGNGGLVKCIVARIDVPGGRENKMTGRTKLLSGDMLQGAIVKMLFILIMIAFSDSQVEKIDNVADGI